MTNDNPESPGITYQASLPLSWRKEPAPSVSMLTAWRYSNISLLRGLATLEAAPMDRDHEADTHLAKALERLENKLDIALTMLAHVTMRNIEMPAPQPVSLGARNVGWLSDQSLPASGDHVLISLYLSPRLPEPLQLHARIISSAGGRCVAALMDEDPEFEEWMTRTLFRYHRRGLQARHQE
jgi:hypothetical protein